MAPTNQSTYRECRTELILQLIGEELLKQKFINTAYLIWSQTTKNSSAKAEEFFVVAQVHSNWNLIRNELHRWKEINSGEVGSIYSTE